MLSAIAGRFPLLHTARFVLRNAKLMTSLRRNGKSVCNFIFVSRRTAPGRALPFRRYHGHRLPPHRILGAAAPETEKIAQYRRRIPGFEKISAVSDNFF